MKNFNVDMENIPLYAMADTSLLILTFAMNHRLLDEVHPAKFESKEGLANRKNLEFKKKLEVLDKRLNRGWQLISSKL